MDKENKNIFRNMAIDELIGKQIELDDICHEILFTLMAYERLRFNELHRMLKKFEIGISKPTLSEHLKHLLKQKLIKRKREDSQNVSYVLNEGIFSLLHDSQENIKEWLDDLKKSKETLPVHLRLIEFDEEEYYRNLPEKELDREIDRDLEYTLCLNIHQLRNMINYDLRIDKRESDAAFWKFIGNPLYRMHERTIAEKCRASARYKQKLFEKMETLINELRSDKSRHRS
jgi:DNA-binding HxlR family transcriptional regulator